MSLKSFPPPPPPLLPPFEPFPPPPPGTASASSSSLRSPATGPRSILLLLPDPTATMAPCEPAPRGATSS
eukprot:9980428-Heterocapsa_arctica.AAC.1